MLAEDTCIDIDVMSREYLVPHATPTSLRRDLETLPRRSALTLLPDNIRTPLAAHPHLVHPSGIDIDPVAVAVCHLLGLRVFRVGYCQLAGEDEVCR